MALLAEDSALQDELAGYGIATETLAEIEPIKLSDAQELAGIYYQVGRNEKLNLTGRPKRLVRSLTTAQVFRIRGERVMFLPSFVNPQQFYITLDYHFLIAQIESEISYISRHWYNLGRPTLILMLTRKLVETGQEPLLELMLQLRDGDCKGTPVRLGSLNQLLLTAGSERIDDLEEFEVSQPSQTEAEVSSAYLLYNPTQSQPLTPTQEFSLECERESDVLLERLRESQNIYEQVEILHTLVGLEGLEFDTGFGGERPVTVADLLEELYNKAVIMMLVTPVPFIGL